MQGTKMVDIVCVRDSGCTVYTSWGDVLESSHEYQSDRTDERKSAQVVKMRNHNARNRRFHDHINAVAQCTAQMKVLLFFFSFSFLSLSLSLAVSLWMLAAGDSEDALAPSLSCACAGADEDADGVASRRKLPRIGIPDTEPARRVVTEIFRASRWKFCEEIRLRFVSDSGSGVPVRSGVPTSRANVIPGAWVTEGAFCDAASSDVPGKATGAESDVGKATGLAWGGAESLVRSPPEPGGASTWVPATAAAADSSDDSAA